MSTYFITRHPGAVEWAQRQGVVYDYHVSHLDIERIGSGDVVIGSLPVNLAARVCQQGARYLHLSLDLPAHLRGKELTATQLQQCNAKLQEYRISTVA